MGAAGSVVKYEDIGAYLVTVVKPNSPGAKAGLQEKVDFIKTMNGVELINIHEQKIVDLVEVSACRQKLLADVDPMLFLFCKQASVGKPIECQVYSSSSGETRTVHVTPSNDWAGEAGDGLLGIKIRLSLYENCTDELGDLVQVNSVPACTGKSAETDDGKPRTALPSFDTGDVPKPGEGVVPEATADDNSGPQEPPLNALDAELRLDQQRDPPQAEAVLVHAKSNLLQDEANVAVTVSAKAEVVAPSEKVDAPVGSKSESPRAAEVEVQ